MNNSQVLKFNKISDLLGNPSQVIVNYPYLRQILERINGNSSLAIKIADKITPSILNFKTELISGIIHHSDNLLKGKSQELIFGINVNNVIDLLDNTDNNLSVLELLEKSGKIFNIQAVVVVSNIIWYKNEIEQISNTLINIYPIASIGIKNIVEKSKTINYIDINLSEVIGISNGSSQKNIFRIERFEFINLFVYEIFVPKLKLFLVHEETFSLFINYNDVSIHMIKEELNGNFIITLKKIDSISEITFYGDFSDKPKISFRELSGSLDNVNFILRSLIKLWSKI